MLRSRIPSLAREARLPAIAICSVVAAIIAVLLSSPSQSNSRGVASRLTARVVTVVARAARTQAAPASGGASPSVHKPAPHHRKVLRPHAGPMTLAKAVGQLIIATYEGPVPPPSILAAVRAGQIGAIILMGDDTTGGVSGTRAAVNELQAAARAGGNPGLLIMTDQEGGEVKRLPGPPAFAAAQMGNVALAGQQGADTAQLLRAAGVNVDLAPVADVSRIDGFMTQEQRTFGNDPGQVAAAACAFASGLSSNGIAYTLKHFPGLGDAVQSTDNVPVNVTEPAAEIHADDQAYRDCGQDPLAVVMVSSASYENLTGSTPAVLSPKIYNQVMPSDGINALTISDSFESGAIQDLPSPAMNALNAGLDMVMYPGEESASVVAYQGLLQDALQGTLSSARVEAAAQKVLALKQNLNLG